MGRVGRTASKPIGAAGKLGLVAGGLIWVVGVLPSADSPVVAVIWLAVLLAPGVWLWWHRRKIVETLDAAPALLDDAERAFTGLRTARLDPLLDAVGHRDHDRGGRRAPRLLEAYRFCKAYVDPLREVRGAAMGQFGALVTVFSPPWFAISAAAAGLAVLLAALLPIVVLVRLVVG